MTLDMKAAIHHYPIASGRKKWVRFCVCQLVATPLINGKIGKFTHSNCGSKFQNQQISSVISEIRTQEIHS